MDWESRTASLILCLAILLGAIHDGNAERKVVCYYTNWSIYRPGTAKFSPQNINPYLCTHLIYAFGGFTKDNALKPFDKYQDIEKGGYAKFTGLKTYNKNLKTLLAIGGWNEGSSRFSPMVADPDRRREFVRNAIKFLRKNHFDGLDLDWEYPAFRDGGKPRDKDNYASLVQELREEFERESSKTGRPRLLLTLAMPAGVEYIDKGYDVPRLNEYLDFVNLLSYDYHSSYEPAVNHHSPLYPLEEDNEYNYDTELTIDYTINYLIEKGASPDKIILGIPTYGRSYTLFNGDATDLGSPADGPGVEGDATREKGYLAYYEICEGLAQSDDWEVIQPNPKAMGPYAFKGDQWVGYDDEDIVRLKARYANEKHLGGIMFWTIDNDDFRGKCHDRPYPLIEAAKEALLSDDASRNGVEKSRTVESRKKPRLQGGQSNAIGRKFGSSVRRSTTTAAPLPKKRVPSSRPRYQTFSRSKASDEEDEQEVGRRSYDSSEESDGGNVVRVVEKGERNKSKGGSRGRLSSSRNRRKQDRRREESRNELQGDSAKGKSTTPEPPTTPDPGTDFKCEDEGFFSHPRDCKKYFWCLDSGPGGLGVVAHQFTCPSGLVFNKAADSCDYPRNVVCPKSKATQTTVSTTRAPITAATSRTTFLYSSTRRPTTAKPNSEEEYEYYDSEEEVEEEEVEASREEKARARTSTTPKALLYKTIARNKPSTTTTTTTTTEAPSTTSRLERIEPEKVLDLEDEEDPRVIKELIKLIKKAGGIEELEKHLLFQDKNAGNAASSGSDDATPATISRTLYERVLSRQASKSGSRGSVDSSYANGPGKAQFEGLDEVPEVKSLRRSQKPQYVTIERPKPSTKEPPVEDEEADEEDSVDDDNEDVASSEEQTVSNPFSRSSTQRVTPNYVNIRRGRPSSSRNENDVDEERPARRRRPSASSKNAEDGSTRDSGDEESRSPSSEENRQTTKTRYVSVQRFRSTTAQPTEVASATASTSEQPVTEAPVPSEAPRIEAKAEQVATTPSTANVPRPIVSSSTPNDILLEPETETPILSSTLEVVASSTTTESVKLVEDSATEILLTTAPASPSTLPAPNTRISSATVSQPRPFGFNRRNRPTGEIATTPLPASTDQTRSKVANSEVDRLPTLKELIGSRSNDYTSSPSPVLLTLLPRGAKDRRIYSREGDATRGYAFSSDAELLDAEKSDAARRELDSSAENVDAYYVEDNLADDEEESSLANKRRIDREDSLPITLKPTTVRGIPLVDLLQSPSPRGFYVTRDEKELWTTRNAQSEPSNVATTNRPPESNTLADESERSDRTGEKPSTTGSAAISESKELATISESKEPTTISESKEPTTILESKEPTTISESKEPTTILESKEPTTILESKEPTTILESKEPTTILESKEPTTILESKEPTTILESKEPTTILESKEPTTILESKEPTTILESKEPTTILESKEPTTISEFKEPTTILESKEPTTILESKEPTTILESKEPTTISESKEPTTILESKEPTTILESKEPTTILESKEPTTILESKEPTTILESKEPTTILESKEPTTILESKEPTTILESKEPTTISESKEPTTILESKEPTTISESKEPTAILESKEPTTILESKEPTTISESKEPTTILESKEPAALTTNASAASRATPVPVAFASLLELESTTTTSNINNTESTLKLTTAAATNLPSQAPHGGSSTEASANSLSTVTEAPRADDEKSLTSSKNHSTHDSIDGTRIKSDANGRQRKVELGQSKEFARESRRRGQTRYSVRPSSENRKDSWKETEATRHPQRRVTNNRGRHRFRPLEKSKTLGTLVEGAERIDAAARVPVKQGRKGNSVRNGNRRAQSIHEETSQKLASKANETRVKAASMEERRRIEERLDGFTAEVNSSTDAETSRTSETLASTRLKRPAALASTPLRSKTSNTLLSHRKSRPSNGTSALVNERSDASGEATETPKLEKDSDQSGKAQEIAVTLADPPSPPSTATGRPPFRNGLRRKISATVASKADATTIRTTLGYGSTLRDRQRPRAKDKPAQNAVARTRRPPVVDYDYYEDEEERVIGKTTLNEKLLLTSKGAVRCLDQGNFPHPYSCKKFITCARMVNGQVVGAEYTCPDKLSFDPVGGICNWSAGLGCRE